MSKRQHGQFYTVINPFNHPMFLEWAKKACISKSHILEPFAGQNSLIIHLKNMSLCNDYRSYDIMPMNDNVSEKDTLLDFPSGYNICVTNPPWLAKNSAKKRKLYFPECSYDDVYKLALEKCLSNCDYIAALVPESYIRTGLFQERLFSFISLTEPIFKDTTHPVGLALFTLDKSDDVSLYSGNKYVGELSKIVADSPVDMDTRVEVKFNDPEGNLGLIALDNTVSASIRFCNVEELSKYNVKNSGRHITKISVNFSPEQSFIRRCNDYVNEFREQTDDILLTSYRGLRKDGKYRRRLDWAVARGIISYAS